ncbi:MAG: SBBP repeat-containing protein, partial [Candidatus Magnetominusculus sp. LBB02]|nr:SBBP repeat-containing protein [Candidatus Magnetominusculus sp. LBB02]
MGRGIISRKLVSGAAALIVVLCLSTAVNANVPAMPASGDNAVISASYGQLPIAFETNAGQADPNIRYFARGQGYMLLMTPQEFVLRMSSYDKAADKVNTAAVRLTFVNTNPDANAMTAIGRLPGTSNYFIGSNAQTWRTNVPTYEKVKYTGLYRGVDLVVYGNQRQIEYDFVVAPHADYKQIALKVKGAKCLTVDKDGSLIIASKGGKMLMHKPLVYQETDGKRQELKCRYKLKKGNLVSFQLSRYDKDKALVIDPTLSYSTYLGGSGSDYSWGIAVDSSGSAYVVGTTISTDFPVTNGAFQTTSKAGVYGTAFISKLNPAGTALEYSTYLGGAGASNGIGMGGDSATAIAVDSSGSAYVAGYTASTDFPVTSGAYQPSRKGSYDAFVTKLNSTGTALVYSTYVGGSGADYCYSIAIDSSGSAYVTGFTASTDFPVTSGAYQTALKGSDSVFITKLNATGTALVYSTYLGGNLYNDAYGIAVDSAGNAYIAGMTDSSDFPVTSGAFQTSLKAGRSGNGFITKLNATGTALVYSTFLGGSTADNCRGIAVDSSGSAYVVGRTASTDFPVTSGAYQTAMKGSYDIFVSKLNTTGAALVYSTYL